LNKMYPGVAEVIRLWFENYKGDNIESIEYKGAKSAWKVIDIAENGFKEGEAASPSR